VLHLPPPPQTHAHHVLQPALPAAVLGASLAGFDFTNNFDYPGNDMPARACDGYPTYVAACGQACLMTVGCQAFTWIPIKRQGLGCASSPAECLLKTAAVGGVGAPAGWVTAKLKGEFDNSGVSCSQKAGSQS
jgi:hypothetical protein